MYYYSVHKGHNKGIFSSWKECKKNTVGYNNSVYEKFTSKKDAEYFLKHGKNPIKVKIESKKSKNNKKIIVYTDGSCINVGKKNAIAGIGVYFGENDKRNTSKRVIGKQTNNIAELSAILEVSKILMKEFKKGISIEICTDSVYSIRCCTTYGKKQDKVGWTKDIPNKELVKKVYNIYKKYPNVTFRHVKAHTGKTDIDSIGNDNADRLAKEATTLNIIDKDKNKDKDKDKDKDKNKDKDNKLKNKIYLDIPYAYREKIKTLGGKWDKKEKKWYIENNSKIFNKKDIKIITLFFDSIIS
jgi:ribonuclease HI